MTSEELKLLHLQDQTRTMVRECEENLKLIVRKTPTDLTERDWDIVRMSLHCLLGDIAHNDYLSAKDENEKS